MSCQRSLSLSLVFLIAVCGLSSLPADDTVAQFQGHLTAGEFALARQTADAAAPQQRDQLLAQLARAQMNAGVPQGSFSTLSSMSDDRARSNVLGGLRNGARGGGAQADFDSLIELITSTIAPQSWDEVGGAGAIDGFDGGVYVDSAGLMKQVRFNPSSKSLLTLRNSSQAMQQSSNVRKKSRLRKVSLNRLERQLQQRWVQGQLPTEAMKNLAGIQKVQFVFIYPESGDVVIAGPADDWTINREGRSVGIDNNRPVLQLDDFVVLLRNAYEENGRFGCSITPTQAGLARTKSFLAEAAKTPVRPSRRDAWLDEFRSTLGKQDITVYGVGANTRVGKVLVEADYRMKLVGMGLEDGTLGVTSYLDLVKPDRNGKLPAMNVLRWWFTLNYKAIQTTKGRDAYALQGQGVKVLSENELLTMQGERKHTGKSDELNLQFTESFTKNFNALADKYAIYAELRNVFDLALIAALLKAEDIPNRIDWHPAHFLDKDRYSPALGVAPTKVESIVNYRVVDRKHFVAGVSGGVTVDTSKLVKRDAIVDDDYGLLNAEHQSGIKDQLPQGAWWWD